MTTKATDWRTYQADLLEAWVTQIRAWEQHTEEILQILGELNHHEDATELRGVASGVRMRANDLNSKAAEMRIAAEENDA